MVRQLIQLLGKEPDEIAIQFVGTRPGEKLIEEICSASEQMLETGHSKIKAFDPPDGDQAAIIEQIDRAIELVTASNDDRLARGLLQRLVPEYHPAAEVHKP